MPDIQEIQNIAHIPAALQQPKKIDAVTQTALNQLDIAGETVKLGVRAYEEINATLLGYIQEAKGHQYKVELLLQFNQELKEGDISPKLKMLAAEIDIKLEGTKLTKEKVSELKSIASSHMESSKSQINIIFSTKISSWQQKLTAIMDIVKEIVRTDQRAKDNILRKIAGR